MPDIDVQRDRVQRQPATESAVPHAAQVEFAPNPIAELQRAVGNQAVQRQLNASALSPHLVLGLQQTLGNQAVQRLLRTRVIQPKLTVTVPDDQYEHEPALDRVSSASKRLLTGVPVPVSPLGAASLQREDDITTSKISETTDTGNKYTQELVLNKTKARIRVNLGVNWVKKGTWASDDAYNKFIRSVKTAVYSYMDNKFKVVCTPTAPAAGPAPIDLPIDFIIYDTASGYTIEAHGGTPGGDSAMAQAGGKVFEFDSSNTREEAITYAHEFGHAMLGASDEYANPAIPGRVLTNDHSIMANYYTQGKAQAAFKARHFQHIATEVAKAFAGYTCSIKPM